MSNAFSPMVTNPYTEHPQALDRAAKIKLLVLDVDGVLTDGSLLVGQDGKEALKILTVWMVMELSYFSQRA